MNDTIHHQLLALLQSIRETKGDSIALEDLVHTMEGLLTIPSLSSGTIRTEIERMLGSIHAVREASRTLALDSHRERELAEVTDTLELIVTSTEEATDSILDATEAIQSLMAESTDPQKDAILDCCMRIMEACNFQDLTGQRVQKLLATFTFIESRLNQLKRFLEDGTLPTPLAETFQEPSTSSSVSSSSHNPARAQEEAAGLLNGPQTPDSAPSQADIDALFSSLK